MRTFIRDKRLGVWEWQIDGVRQGEQLTEAALGKKLKGNSDAEIRCGESAALLAAKILKRSPEEAQ